MSAKETTFINCSTGTLAAAVGDQYYNIEAALAAAGELRLTNLELLLHPEWRSEHPPLTPFSADWPSIPKFAPHQVSRLVDEALSQRIRINSIHANRDVGMLLAAGDTVSVDEGIEQLDYACRLAERVGARVIVLHAWDTYAEEVPVEGIARHLNGYLSHLPGEVVLTVENIPVSHRGLEPAEFLASLLDTLDPQIGLTIDLTWTSLYDNLPDLLPLVGRVENVHIQCMPDRDGTQVVIPKVGQLSIERAVGDLLDANYNGLWTLELVGARGREDFLTAISHLEGLLNR